MNNTLHESRIDSTVSVGLENINLSFGKTHVLKGIDLQIEPGEFFAFLGPSGCGKKCPICRHGSAIWAWCSRVTPCGLT